MATANIDPADPRADGADCAGSGSAGSATEQERQSLKRLSIEQECRRAPGVDC